MKQWSATLEDELLRWPDVTTRPMFGLIGLYRHDTIFAALPRTRAMRSANAISLRFDPLPARIAKRAKSDPRMHLEDGASTARRWHIFELSSNDDLRDALDWLAVAYASARNPKAANSKKR
jgi:TfoX/Sxy family transcriptional regulator of competence genes